MLGAPGSGARSSPPPPARPAAARARAAPPAAWETPRSSPVARARRSAGTAWRRRSTRSGRPRSGCTSPIQPNTRGLGAKRPIQLPQIEPATAHGVFVFLPCPSGGPRDLRPSRALSKRPVPGRQCNRIPVRDLSPSDKERKTSRTQSQIINDHK